MKKILFAFILLIGSYTYSQSSIVLSRNDLLAGASFDNRITGASGKTLSYNEIAGSPYPDKIFKDAKIAENYQNTAVRYNAYKDEVEFEDGSEIRILPKDQKFERIEIISPKQTLVYLNLAGESAGYYYEIAGGKTASAYKKIKTNFKDRQPASSPYGTDQPASFTTTPPTYFIVLNGQVIKKPKNQKMITDIIPEKKDAVNSFFKENKIKLEKEEDLKKMITFLNQN